MAPKKAHKKAAKKAPKKGPKHHEEHGGRDLRRAYEHLGRLHALQGLLASEVAGQVKGLTGLAESRLQADDAKSAADLLRAGEHLAFGSLASASPAKGLSEELEAALHTEVHHLTVKAVDHWARHEELRPEVLVSVYEKMVAAAKTAFEKRAYRRALEFARGADALAHVRWESAGRLEAGGSAMTLRLK